MANAPDRPNIPPLTSLRFFAAMVVVVFHYNPDRFERLPELFQGWLETGYEAVTFFFVLSGFVLTYVYADADLRWSGKSLRAFFVARFSRLFPAYYVSLLVVLPFVVREVLAGEKTVGQFALEGVFVTTSLQAWWPPAALAWNPPGWSLSVEWFLYATFPLLVLAVRRVPPGLLVARVFAFVACASAFRLLVMVPLAEADAETWYAFSQFFPLFHLPQFLFGMALAQLHRLGPRPSPAVAGWMGIGGIVGLMVVFGTLDDAPAWLRSDAVLVALFGLMIFGAAQDGHVAHRVLSTRPLLFLGNISFAVYALHQPLSLCWSWFVDEFVGRELPSLIDFPIYVSLVLGLSALCYVLVETPLRRRIRRWGPRPADKPRNPAS